MPVLRNQSQGKPWPLSKSDSPSGWIPPASVCIHVSILFLDPMCVAQILIVLNNKSSEADIGVKAPDQRSKVACH